MSVNKYNSTTGELERIAGGLLYADAPIGTISPFGGSVIPSGYLLCNGQAVSRTTYAELFAVIGTAFGTGDGSTTFNVPDLREAVPKGTGLNAKGSYHYDNDGIALGEFIDDRIKLHAHNVYVRDTGHGHAVDATSATNWNQGVSLSMCALNVSPATMYPTTSTGSGKAQIQVNSSSVFDGEANTTSTTGSFTNEVKAVGVNYIIKAKQVSVPFDVAEYIRKWNELEPIPSVRIGSFTGWTQGDLMQNYTMEYDGIVNVFLDSNLYYYVITDLSGSETQIYAPTAHGDASSSMSLFLKRGYKIRLSTNAHSGMTIQYYLNRD